MEPAPRSATSHGARVLAMLGDSITTDHISPAGVHQARTGRPAKYLVDHQVRAGCEDFNSYGSRRGNHEVMMRGTFANIRTRPRHREAGFTVDFTGKPAPQGASPLPDHCPTTGIADAPVRYIYDAVQNYKTTPVTEGSSSGGTPLVVLAGKSTTAWVLPATGPPRAPSLLNVKAVLAESPSNASTAPTSSAWASARHDHLSGRHHQGDPAPLPDRYGGGDRICRERRRAALRAAQPRQGGLTRPRPSLGPRASARPDTPRRYGSAVDRQTGAT